MANPTDYPFSGSRYSASGTRRGADLDVFKKALCELPASSAARWSRNFEKEFAAFLRHEVLRRSGQRHGRAAIRA